MFQNNREGANMKTIYDQIENYLTYCEKVRKMSSVTINTKRYILTRFARETEVKNLKKLSNPIFNYYIAKLTETGASGRSVNTYSASILAFVKYYQKMGMKMPFRPILVRKLKETKIERTFYTKKEIGRVLKKADFETKLMIEMMFETGMRISEVANLKIADFSGQRIRFVGKGNKSREVYIGPATLKMLEKHLEKNQIRDFLWGKTLNGEPPTAHTLRKRLKRTFSGAGFTGFYPHALRHSFATNLQKNGASVAEIKEMMGHSSVATTERYLHGFDGKMRELFEKYT
jgi:integrase/recombinase XerC